MSKQTEGTYTFCGGRLAFDPGDVGRIVSCPHCGRSITLGTQPATVNVRPVGSGGWKLSFFLVCVVLLIAAVIAIPLVSKQKADAQRQVSDELARHQLEEQRLKIELEKAKAEADLAKAQLLREEQAKAAAAATADNQKKAAELAAEEAAKQKAADIAKREQEIKDRLKDKPRVLALWDESDHSAIRITATRPNEATLHYKGESLVAKFDDMPEWLRTSAEAKYKQEGEARGLIREVDGKTYDLRTSPPGWIALPLSEVVQIVNDGYLMIDVSSLKQPYAESKVYKLKHNGLARILNTGDRVQMAARSVGTYDYENKNFEIMRVPVYDPGVPVGPLRDRIVAMRAPATKKADDRPKPAPGEPSATGSGFFISEDGLFITNAHVVEDSTKFEVKGVSGKKRATLLRVDKDKDLALLRVAVDGPALPLRISTDVLSIGTQVFTIGYPMVDVQGSKPKYTDGKVSSVAGLRDNPDQMQISVAVQPGNSGGPLADSNGDVAGVIVAKLNDIRAIAIAGTIPQNVNYAVKSSTLVQFLRENRDVAGGVRFGRSTPPRASEDAIKTVERASGMILAYE
jgi:S1-C subfamily serine protease